MSRIPADILRAEGYMTQLRMRITMAPLRPVTLDHKWMKSMEMQLDPARFRSLLTPVVRIGMWETWMAIPLDLLKVEGMITLLRVCRRSLAAFFDVLLQDAEMTENDENGPVPPIVTLSDLQQASDIDGNVRIQASRPFAL
jgi:hypothetical protein